MKRFKTNSATEKLSQVLKANPIAKAFPVFAKLQNSCKALFDQHKIDNGVIRVNENAPEAVISNCDLLIKELQEIKKLAKEADTLIAAHDPNNQPAKEPEAEEKPKTTTKKKSSK